MNGISQENFEFYGIGLQELNKNEITKSFHIGLSASFKSLNLKFPSGTYITSPDSINLMFEQRTISFYEPWRVWQIPQNFSDYNDIIDVSDSGYMYGSLMGPWTIVIDKWKNGVHTITEDSIFMEMGGVNEYVIPW